MLNSFSYKSNNGTVYTNCHLWILRYKNTQNLALAILNEDHHHLNTITTNVNNPLPDNIIAIRNYSGNKCIEDLLKQIGIIEEQPLTAINDILYYAFTPEGMKSIKEWKDQQNY